MLSFVNNNSQIVKPHIPKKPEIAFGVSIQSPQYFIKPYSMISSQSYNNPYLNLSLQQDRNHFDQTKNDLNLQSNASWTHRIHLTNFSHINNINGHLTCRNQESEVATGLNHSIASVEYFSPQKMKDSKLFHKRKGQFTQYLQNHLSNIEFIGPILGNQRSKKRNFNTKMKILAQKLQKLERTKKNYTEHLQHTKEYRNMSPLLQKTKIRRQRERELFKVSQTYKIKQNVIQKSKQFQLPKINGQFCRENLTQMKQNYLKTKNQNKMTKFCSFESTQKKSLKNSQDFNHILQVNHQTSRKARSYLKMSKLLQNTTNLR